MSAKRFALSENDTASDSDIKHLCSYISDNGAIAAYFGVDRSRVERVRNQMANKPSRAFRPSRHCGDQRRSGDEPAGSTVHMERERITACTKALLQAQARWLTGEAARHRVSLEEVLNWALNGKSLTGEVR